jgi:threonine aldolase
MIDLRSDTVTRPTPAMRRAMAEAEVGDDVYREDPTVRRLEEKAAEILGKEAALFVPTGSMGNEIAVAVHARPGEEVILDADSHIMNHELGMMAAFAGAMPRPVQGDRGFPTAAQIEAAVRPSTYYYCRASLVCLENTHNLQGGGIYPRERFREVAALARTRGLRLHLDGARLFNAAVASGVEIAKLTEGADSVMFCLSKGLAAPVGSILAGSGPFIEEGVSMRKRMGGGMRQAGVLAAAGIVALETMVSRLADDHANARLLAERLAAVPGLEIDPARVETNIVMFRTLKQPAPAFVEDLRKAGVLCLPFSAQLVRMVTHADVSRQEVLKAADEVRRIAG